MESRRGPHGSCDAGIEAIFGLRVRFSWKLRQAGLITGVMHSNPYQMVGPGRHEAGRDSGTTATSPSLKACHAIEAHRFPERRPFIPGVHSAVEAEVLVRVGLGP